MSDYTYTSDFGAKDGKNTGDPDKVIKGADFETEFSAIQTAVNSKSNSASPTFTGTATIPTASVTTLNLGGTAVTSTAAELNILDGVTADATDLNYTDITTLGTVEASKVVTADANGDVNFPDNDKAVFGSDTDLEIFHNGTKGVIDNITGNIEIKTRADNSDVFIQSDDGSGGLSTYFMADGSEGEAKMFHYGTEKLATKSTGINVSGTISVDDVEITATPAEINKLDGLTAVGDYVTGTFTPEVSNVATGGTVATVGSSTGRYIAIGDLVTVFIRITNINTSSFGDSSQVLVRNLPYASRDDSVSPMYTAGSMHMQDVTAPAATNSGAWTPVITDNTSHIVFYAIVSGNAQPEILNFGDLADDVADLFITITYEK